jgi:hypothetical protein
MTGLKILGMTDEGTCDHCGANCPKRRVSVMTGGGEVESWGVVCASKARGERGNATDAKILTQFARAVDEFRAVIAAGGGEAEIRAASRWGFPWEIRAGVLSVWSGRAGREPDAKIPLAA